MLLSQCYRVLNIHIVHLKHLATREHETVISRESWRTRRSRADRRLVTTVSHLFAFWIIELFYLGLRKVCSQVSGEKIKQKQNDKSKWNDTLEDRLTWNSGSKLVTPNIQVEILLSWADLTQGKVIWETHSASQSISFSFHKPFILHSYSRGNDPFWADTLD